MPFDAGMLSFIVREINKCGGGKIEKIQQPERDEINLLLRSSGETRRLIINAGSNLPRITFSTAQKENPVAAPMFCMLLRKHLTGAKFAGAYQPDFERSVELCFDGYDDLGFATQKYIIAEIMGKYSNIILTDAEKKIIGALKIIDFSMSEKRQILPGMTYELPPKQDKLNPLAQSRDELDETYRAAPPDMNAETFINSRYFGISKLVARELVFRASGRTDSVLSECAELPKLLAALGKMICEGEPSPSMLSDKDGKPLEYAYLDLLQFGIGADVSVYPTCSELIDAFYETRANTERIKQRASDIFRLLTNAENRIVKKINLQTRELEECAEGEKFKLYGELITANMYNLKRGDSEATVENYYEDPPVVVKIPLDVRQNPSQNAQRYYKKYTKSKTAERVLTEQLALARSELEYVYSVFDALTRSHTEADITEIREELHSSGYASKMKNFKVRKPTAPKPLKFKTTDGRTVYCGKNNLQNDFITFKLADKNDWWFHAKGVPGSHVLMVTDGYEPTDRDFTEAATIAATHSKNCDSPSVDVDYTIAKNIKKPSGGKPGFVVYYTNWSATVKPDKALTESLSAK